MKTEIQAQQFVGADGEEAEIMTERERERERDGDCFLIQGKGQDELSQIRKCLCLEYA